MLLVIFALSHARVTAISSHRNLETFAFRYVKFAARDSIHYIILNLDDSSSDYTLLIIHKKP
jgi:hypothetical protein